MGGRKRDEIPPVLARAQARFLDWRGKRTIGTRVPEPLWALAVKLAIAHGVSRTASALRLDYYSLKKRLEAVEGRQPAAEPAFVELPASFAVGKHCTFELGDGAGSTLRIQLVGYDAADVAALSGSLWNAE
jgi:transcription elongation GreA/GreB family factor